MIAVFGNPNGKNDIKNGKNENGAPGLLRTEFFEGGHHCGLREQQLILDFFSNLYYDKPY